MLKSDCTYFPGDRPCDLHKTTGVKCESCTKYSPIASKILIIKLDAIGDVLRTTSILPALKSKYPEAHITWCTRKNARELFLNNYYVNSLIFLDEDANFRLQVEKFDIVINLDTSKLSSSIASFAKGNQKIGFVLDENGCVKATNHEAMQWLEMSAFDDVKKSNLKTYQQIMYSIIGLDQSTIYRPILNLIQTDRSQLLERYRINEKKITIGLNTGVGSRWPNKGWPLENWIQFIRIIGKNYLNLLLLGGPEEREKNLYLRQSFDFLIDTGCDNTISEFIQIVDLCDILITADTFALHIGTALNKYIIALFGPTSSSEIELYGRGKKILSSKNCECYYNRFCKSEISCLSKIDANHIYNEIKSLINQNL